MAASIDDKPQVTGKKCGWNPAACLPDSIVAALLVAAAMSILVALLFAWRPVVAALPDQTCHRTTVAECDVCEVEHRAVLVCR